MAPEAGERQWLGNSCPVPEPVLAWRGPACLARDRQSRAGPGAAASRCAVAPAALRRAQMRTTPASPRSDPCRGQAAFTAASTKTAPCFSWSSGSSLSPCRRGRGVRIVLWQHRSSALVPVPALLGRCRAEDTQWALCSVSRGSPGLSCNLDV